MEVKQMSNQGVSQLTMMQTRQQLTQDIARIVAAPAQNLNTRMKRRISMTQPNELLKQLFFPTEKLNELEKEIRTVPVDGEGNILEVGYTDMFVRNTVTKLIADHRAILEENKRLKSVEHTLCLTIGEADKALQQTREELEYIRPMVDLSLHEVREELERLKQAIRDTVGEIKVDESSETIIPKLMKLLAKVNRHE
jgi:hypothetical protein